MCAIQGTIFPGDISKNLVIKKAPQSEKFPKVTVLKLNISRVLPSSLNGSNSLLLHRKWQLRLGTFTEWLLLRMTLLHCHGISFVPSSNLVIVHFNYHISTVSACKLFICVTNDIYFHYSKADGLSREEIKSINSEISSMVGSGISRISYANSKCARDGEKKKSWHWPGMDYFYCNLTVYI